MESVALPHTRFLKLSAVFALIYFFSPNGLAALPGITISFLLKDTLHMTASQASYFGAITILGWALKPLWGIISDAFPLFGYRRKSYLIITSLGAAFVWLFLGTMEHYATGTILLLFTLSSIMYAFMDVLCDALMVETGKPLNLTSRFQSIQWTAVYTASIITGLAGGWVATHWNPQKTFSLNALFPLMILAAIFFFLKETRAGDAAAQRRVSFQALREAARDKQLWLLAAFLFFVAFSPSFGAPFFYYSVDALKFDPMLFGTAASVGAASAAIGAIIYGKYGNVFKTRMLVKLAIIVGTVATLFDLVYFVPFITTHLEFARWIYLASAAILGGVGAITFIVMLNAAALACPKWSEGTTFATLTAFWNVGLMGSSALGGYLFGLIGLQPLIIISALFTAAAWAFLPRLHFADDSQSNRE
ncbi:MAG: MFS transporter [Candidatus Liptonbacteria bacterium]|nr:MFS transporter [Candidatus Liptonbacteria bacterium]